MSSTLDPPQETPKCEQEKAGGLADTRAVMPPQDDDGVAALDSTRRDRIAPNEPESPESDPLALPAAAQRPRPSTPRRSASPALSRRTSSSTSSSGETVICSNPQRSLPVAERNPATDDSASDDSLRLMPVGSSAVKSNAVAVKSNAVDGGGGGGAQDLRSRWMSSPAGGDEEPDETMTDASPTRQKSKTPLALSEGTTEPTGSRATSSDSNRRGASQEANGASTTRTADSDDDLDLLSSSQAPPRPRKKRRGVKGSRFVCVEVPLSSRSSMNSMPRGTPVQTSERTSPAPQGDPVAETAASAVQANEESQSGSARKRRKVEHPTENEETGSELPVDASQSRSSPRGATPVPPDPMEPTVDTTEIQNSDAPAVASDNSNAASSPLSSIPATSPLRVPARGTDLSPSTAIVATKRPLSPTLLRESEHDSLRSVADEPTMILNHGSPPKKPRVPKVSLKKTTSPTKAAEATKPAPRRRKHTRQVETDAEKDALDGAEEAEAVEAPQREVALDTSWGTRPQRNKSARRSMREVSSDGGSDSSVNEDEDSRSESSPAKKRRLAPKAKSQAAARTRDADRKRPKKEVGATKRKSQKKGKGKEKEDSDREAGASEAASSPLKSSFKPTSSFLLDLSQPTKSKRESPEERAQGWDVREFDDYVWVHIEEREGNNGGFWWLGKITNKLRSERPLSIELFVDPESTIHEYSSQAIVPIEEPSPDNLLKFRSRSSASTLRFNRETFRDSPTSTPDLDELGTAFDAVLEQTLQLESALDADSDDSDALPDLSQPVTARPAKELKRKKRTDSSEEEAEVRVDSESEDELLREKDEVSSFPFYCIAKEAGGWWPASCVGHADDDKSAKGRNAKNGSKRRFKIEYPSGEKSVLSRSSLLFSRQKQFATVKLQETVVEFPPTYLENAVAFIKASCGRELQQTLEENYAPAKPRNDAFYAGGREREQLAQMSVFGELPANFIEDFSDTIKLWLLPSGGSRPKGSLRYEALSDLERVRYIADVLLPVAIILNHIDDAADAHESLEDRARKTLEADGQAAPSPEEVRRVAFDIAYQELNSRSATKAGEFLLLLRISI
ncbi:hypothetical protein JCM3766R1_000013 [Sporobolomyces carnicolor]